VHQLDKVKDFITLNVTDVSLSVKIPPLVQQEPHIVCKTHSYFDLYFESFMKTGERKDH
jgi:hypothetical protein